MTTAIQEVEVSVGQKVVFVDQTAVRHDAVVTAVHGPTSLKARTEYNAHMFGSNRKNAEDRGTPIPDWCTKEAEERANNAPFVVPSINVVFVVSDEAKTDSYGRQIDRATSVPHRQLQSAHGYYWTL